MGQPYVADVFLHEAWDALDLSFELGFPEIRWPANNVVEFYRPQYFEDGNDIFIVQNRSGKPLKSLFVHAVSTFLVVDMRPAASLSLKAPKARSDWQWIVLEGLHDDGTKIPRHDKSFRRSEERRVGKECRSRSGRYQAEKKRDRSDKRLGSEAE